MSEYHYPYYPYADGIRLLPLSDIAPRGTPRLPHDYPKTPLPKSGASPFQFATRNEWNPSRDAAALTAATFRAARWLFGNAASNSSA